MTRAKKYGEEGLARVAFLIPVALKDQLKKLIVKEGRNLTGYLTLLIQEDIKRSKVRRLPLEERR